MPSIWRRSMLYLGLGPDEEYEELQEAESGRAADADEVLSDGEEPTVRVLADSQSTSGAAPPAEAPVPTAMPNGAAAREPAEASAGHQPMAPVPSSPAANAGFEETGSVRTIPVSNAKPHVVSPQAFNDAQQVADRFKADQPILVNLQDVDRELARRLIDFTSGLCYALNGSMEKVGESIYLLSPANIRVPEDERRRLQERGLHH